MSHIVYPKNDMSGPTGTNQTDTWGVFFATTAFVQPVDASWHVNAPINDTHVWPVTTEHMSPGQIFILQLYANNT